MKKNLFTTIFMSLIAMIAMAQATSLTIDNQTPGWLSSKINYGDQQTLKNLKVTGYINGTDIKFIRELNLNRSLRGVIDLEDANILSGGEAYYKTYVTKDNIFTDYMFAGLKSLQKVILPKSLTSWKDAQAGGTQFCGTQVDTLVINGSMKSISCGGYDNNYNLFHWHVRCIYFPEGVTSINLNYFFHNDANLEDIELFFPSTLGWIYGSSHCTDDEAVFHCNSIRPDTITTQNYSPNSVLFNNGTIYVPKGTTELYQNSIFRKLIIIEDIPVEGIAIDTDSIGIHVGETTNLNVSILPEDAINQTVIYSSKDPEICTIDSTGCITALSVGRNIVYAYSHDKQFVDSCLVQVFEHTTGVSVDSSVKIRLGDEVQLNGQTCPDESDGCLTWKSSNEEIAIVNDYGLVKGIRLGSCVVSATSVDGGFNADCLVTVVQPVDGVTLEKHSLSLNVGESEQLYANVIPVNADNKSLIWTTSDSEVAEVNVDGNVTAKKCGVAFIKVTSEDNPLATDSCKITVLQPVTGIKLNYSTVELHQIGETIQLVATIFPEDASNKEVRWVSSNESVSMVANGTVVAVGYGTSVIIATTVDGNYMATCTVTVVEGVDFPGDVNHDGEVNIADINAIINIILGGNVDDQTRERADVNGDGEVNIADINAIIDIILNT